jgi:ParB family chromosome partitioning protein
MRHDSHYVEELSKPLSAPLGRMIPVAEIDPNPNQPRAHMGDLSELIRSIKEKGVLEPLLVRYLEGPRRYQIIAGERRYHAAVEAGLRELPCIVKQVDESELLELALIENLQRKDLTAFEEADGYQALIEQFHYTHEELAKRIGKSRSIITETLSLAAIPSQIQDLCREAGISSKGMLLQIARQGSAEQMRAAIERIRSGELSTREQIREQRIAKKQESKDSKLRSRAAEKVSADGRTFAYAPPHRRYTVQVRFASAPMDRSDIIKALTEALQFLSRSL